MGLGGVSVGSGGVSGIGGGGDMKLEVTVRVNTDDITPYFELPEEGVLYGVVGGPSGPLFLQHILFFSKTSLKSDDFGDLCDY